ncbi:MAG: hypothetical protein ACPLY9_01495 [Nitrososphaerales archaeon]
MSWGKFEWLKQLKEIPKYAEITQQFHSEISFERDKIRNRGFLVTEANTE